MDKSKFAVATYDKIAGKYTRKYFNDLTDLPYIDRFLKKLPSGARILDIGCGPGTFTKYLLEKGFNVEGIDLSEEMIKIAKVKVPKANFKLMDMRRISYPGNFFDGLLAAYSLIHIPTEEMIDTLRGFKKILKPNGSMMIIVQGGEPDKFVNEPLKKGEKIFINFFTKERLSKLVAQAGFEIEYQEEIPMRDSDSLSDRVIYTIARKVQPLK